MKMHIHVTVEIDAAIPREEEGSRQLTPTDISNKVCDSLRWLDGIKDVTADVTFEKGPQAL
jgi:hypothetical protein